MHIEAQNIILKDGRTAIIRMAEERDAASLAIQSNLVAGESRNLCSTVEESNFTVESETTWIRAQLKPRAMLLVADVEGRIVGVCSLRPEGERQRILHRCSFGISVLKEFWGNGIGTMLIRGIIEAAKGYGYEQLELNVISTNDAAIHVYRKLGFVQWGLLPHAFKYEDGSYGDFCTMALDLTK